MIFREKEKDILSEQAKYFSGVMDYYKAYDLDKKSVLMPRRFMPTINYYFKGSQTGSYDPSQTNTLFDALIDETYDAFILLSSEKYPPPTDKIHLHNHDTVISGDEGAILLVKMKFNK